MRNKYAQPEVAPAVALSRRAMRLLRRGDARKAVMTLREATALDGSGAMFTRLGYALTKAGKKDEAIHAFKEALFLFRHEDMRGRARTVARMILALDPTNTAALRRAA